MRFKSNFMINIILSNVKMTLIAAHLNAGVVLGGDSVAFGILRRLPPGISVPATTKINTQKFWNEKK